MNDIKTLEAGKFHYAPSMEIFIGLTRGSLHPTKVLMPFDMFIDFAAVVSRSIGSFPPLKFHGADVEMSEGLLDNQIEFQNEIEPTLPEFNGRFELGKDIGTDRIGLPIDWKRVDG